ncbi:hypothetical protein CRE_01600 [Caenorhabditis remanei]|uniref:Uncharacterized protein n=1 Tax=Caenorhabditis remanei TaxID=31234 RepID=E3LGP9_CAERE|nr:hypothetical protein CRE_01600 [Caenorhabditis remanei]
MACEITVGSSLKDISFVNSDIIAALESNSTKLYQTDTSRRIMTIGCEEETKQLHGADENCFLIQYTGIRILKISTGQLIDGTLLERTRRFWPVTGNRKEWPPSLRTSRAEAECMNCFLIQNAGISILKIKTGQLVRWHTVEDNEEILASHMNSATEKMFDKWKPAILRSINESSFMAASETGPVKLCDFGKSNKPIWTTPVLDRINAVEDVGLSNVCVITDSKVLLMDSTLGKKKMSIDMKPNEKCVGVLRHYDMTTESKRSHILKYETHLTTPNLYCRFKDELFATCDGKGRVIIQYGNTSQNEFAAEAKKLKDRNRKRQWLRRSSTFSKPIGRKETKGEKTRGIWTTQATSKADVKLNFP